MEHYDQFMKQMETIGSETRWIWFNDGNLRRETEILIIATRKQAFTKNLNIGKDQRKSDNKCRMCRKECRHDCIDKEGHCDVS